MCCLPEIRRNVDIAPRPDGKKFVCTQFPIQTGKSKNCGVWVTKLRKIT